MSKTFKKLILAPIFMAFFLLTACVHQNITKFDDGNEISSSFSIHSGLTGSYLAGRFAQHNNDWQSASRFMQKVLVEDKDNNKLLHRAFLLALGNGNFEKAIELAEKITSKGIDSELAILMMVVDEISKDQSKAAWDRITNLDSSEFNKYMQPVLQSWLLVMLGSEDVALASLKKHINVFDTDPLYLLHMALISEYGKDYEHAEKFYDKVLSNGELTVYSALTAVSYYERHGKHEKAEKLYKEIGEQMHLYKMLSLQEVSGLFGAAAKDPKEAVSLVLFELSTLLFERKAYDSALIYVRLAQALSPSSNIVTIMLGDILAAQGNYEEAVKHYNAIKQKTGMLHFARLKAAAIMEANGQGDEAIALLKSVSEQGKAHADALIHLGDIYRRQENYKKAVEAYDNALDLIGKVKAEHWFIVYARGMSNERLKKWDSAEKDLLEALALQPENPIVLNYLGYSWVEKGMHLEKAQAMIKKAVVLRPGDGYITDSYGWALYRVGNFIEAVEWLEYSAERIPYDMTINDHLGDAYWRVDRKIEARFQWKRAYNATSNASEQKALEHKIKYGLPDATNKTKLSSEREAMLR